MNLSHRAFRNNLKKIQDVVKSEFGQHRVGDTIEVEYYALRDLLQYIDAIDGDMLSLRKIYKIISSMK